jgi:hypothetical protein
VTPDGHDCDHAAAGRRNARALRSGYAPPCRRPEMPTPGAQLHGIHRHASGLTRRRDATAAQRRRARSPCHVRRHWRRPAPSSLSRSRRNGLLLVGAQACRRGDGSSCGC